MNESNLTDELLMSCLDGAATDAEYEQAWHWVHASPANERHYRQLRDAWLASGLLQPVDIRRQQEVWNRIEKRIDAGRRFVKQTGGGGKHNIQRIIYRWTAVAAALALAYWLGTGSEAGQSATPSEQAYIINVPNGGKSEMTLSDGTRVWLNAGSELCFSPSFGKEQRQLKLTGEAYFEVAHDEQHPFVVEASGLNIAALGTAFNVKAYTDDDKLEATLVEGSIKLNSSAKKEGLLLKPNEKAVYYKYSDSLPHPSLFARAEVKTVDTDVVTSWRNKRWIIQGQTLAELAPDIERHYDVKIVFANEALKHYTITAALEDESIEQLLRALRLTVPINYRISKGKVYLNINRDLKNRYDQMIQNRS